MKTTDPSLKFVCPICGAQPKERCEMNSGTPAFDWTAQPRVASTTRWSGPATSTNPQDQLQLIARPRAMATHEVVRNPDLHRGQASHAI